MNEIARKIIQEFKDGDSVSHHWLKLHFDMDEPKTAEQLKAFQFEYLGKIEMLKAVLLKEHKVALRTMRGYGYQLVPPSEQTQFAVTRGLVKIGKAIEETVDTLDHTRVNLLSDDEKRQHTDSLVKFSAIKGIMAREKKDALAIIG